MDFVSPILDIATRLWDCTAKRAVYIRDLQENLDSLKRLTEELSNSSKDVMGRVKREEQFQRLQRTHEVDGWLKAVQLMQAQVEEILKNGDQEIQKKCLGCCPKNCRSSYRLGKIVTKKIDAVTELKGKGQFDVVVHSLPSPPVDERPMGKTVGLELMFDKVRTCLEDEQVRSVGLYGIGGVGKTTLLQKINNEYFGRRNDFDVVIWVVVSKPVSISKIQLMILKKLGAQDEEWKNSSKEEKAAEIFKVLKAKRFAILLDDMWERLDLLEVGIPLVNDQTKHSKVVLTTRSERVCDGMEVDMRLKIECLTPDEAFSLFCDKVGENLVNSHPDITRLAKIVVKECRGLPLALVVIGRSMASRKTPREWEQAIQVLKSYPAKFSGMGDQVFSILKFSYDNLDNDTIKSCFLYCSLYPEDHVIPHEDLINLWLGEGLLGKFGDIYEARNQGEEIIRSLKDACLLEGDVYGCRMHDVIRDMALWLSCDSEEEKPKSFVLDHVKLIEAHETVKWKAAQRIALWDSNINEQLSLSPSCFLNLQTLILRNSDTTAFPTGFFQHMPLIRVLDLEGNTELVELPLEICRLERLEYLNLRWTAIEKLPIQLKDLTNLRCLLLDCIFGLEVIPPDVICCLSDLQMFGMILDSSGVITHEEGFMVSVLQELECLQYLSEVSISLPTLPDVQKFLTSHKLHKCIDDLRIIKCQGLTEMELPISTLHRMRSIQFQNCEHLDRVKINMANHGFPRGLITSNSNLLNLVKVDILGCHQFLDLTWLIYAPSIEQLVVTRNDKMEEIIGSGSTSDEDGESGDSEIEQPSLSIFSRLRILYLNKLPNLKSICRRAMPFPSLTSIIVLECPNLRKLPLSSSSATNALQKIEGESSWWVKLEWEDDNLKLRLLSVFHDIDDYGVLEE